MDSVANKKNITFKASRKPVWKLPCDVFKHFKENFGVDIALKDFRIILDTAYMYYLDEMGLSVSTVGIKVDKSLAQYMWAQLDNCKTANGEPLYVWMIKNDDGIFGNIAFGTKTIFDAIIVETLKNKII